MASRDEQHGRSERSRRAILDAARAEFAARGYAGATLSAVAARAGVNQQLIAYHFGDKQGLYLALSADHGHSSMRHALAEGDLADQLRRFVLQVLRDPEGLRLLAWGGLEYAGRGTDPDQEARRERMRGGVADVRALQAAGRLPADLDPACLTVMLMAAAMAITTLPQELEAACDVDPRLPEFVEHYADQVAGLVRALGA